MVLHIDKYQTWVRTCPSAPNKMSVLFTEHLATFIFTFFAYCFEVEPTA